MTEVYKVNGVNHEIVNASHRVPDGAFIWIDVRCHAQLPPQLGPANVSDTEPVTCLFCLGYVEPDVDPEEDEAQNWGYGHSHLDEDEDGSVYYGDDDD